MLTREMILEHISPIEDPELHIGLVDLGLIYDVNVYLVFEPPWDPAEMASDAAKDELGIW